MMNSPCAMLITFIWPNVNVRPSAMSSRIDAMLRPTKTWLRNDFHRVDPAARSLVPLAA